ncbi:MGMT family protein [Pseudalkalibacillus sp. SCS-8]|uniref:MGMT family protein n=1 Tax=Pseudalkalibacillus nanhaiensis TaxID=3115291 RepID=UPI0032DA510B
MTYGQIAKLAGSPKGARQVVRVLHTMSKPYDLPWHRVINSKGEISIQDEVLASLQKQKLHQEGVPTTSPLKIDLKHYQHHPEEWIDDVNII